MTEISSLTDLAAAPADGDQLVILDVSDTTQSANGTTKKLAASRVARTGAANTFTAAQTINSPTAATIPLILNAASGATADILNLKIDGDQVVRVASDHSLQIDFYDNGSSYGPYITVNRNSNASTPAAGFIFLVDKSATAHRVWVDDPGNLRISPTLNPTNANDLAGTVIGTQTSWHELKENIEEWTGSEALEAIRQLTLYSYQMKEDGQQTTQGQKPTYYGIVIMDEDRESNAWFGLGYGDQQIPALNDRNLFGYMLAAIRHGGDIIEALQTQVAALEARVAALEGA